jgi:hypothetical protein
MFAYTDRLAFAASMPRADIRFAPAVARPVRLAHGLMFSL